MKKQLLLFLATLLLSLPARSEDNLYRVEIKAPAPIVELLEKHLKIIQWRDSPRMTKIEWQRLFSATPENIRALLTTEGYFSPLINSNLTQQNKTSVAEFDVNPGTPTTVKKVELNFTNAITLQTKIDTPSIVKLREDWLLKENERFRQEDWERAKRNLLARLIVERYPNATISNSKAEITPETQSAALSVDIDRSSIQVW